jgi:hypothetical protein
MSFAQCREMPYQFTEHSEYIRAVIPDDASMEEFVGLFREMKTLSATRGVGRGMVVVRHNAGAVPTFEHLSSYAGAGFMDGFKLALVCGGWALYRGCQKAERAAEKAGVHARAFFQEAEGSHWLSQ